MSQSQPIPLRLLGTLSQKDHDMVRSQSARFLHNVGTCTCSSFRPLEFAYELVVTARDVSTKHKRSRSHIGKTKTLDDRVHMHKRLDVKDWEQLVTDYTCRNLTYPGDRLYAFSAILRRLYCKDIDSNHTHALSGFYPACDATHVFLDSPTRRPRSVDLPHRGRSTWTSKVTVLVLGRVEWHCLR